MLLSAELRARLERLSISSRRRVSAQWAGRHSSRHKGESLDFADYREYVPGDDFRRIDHNLWARLGVLLVRQFEAEEELPLRIVVDTSASMGFYRKLEVAKVLAAMMAYLGLAGGDRVHLVAVPGGQERGRSGPGRQSTLLGPSGRHLSRWPYLESWLEGLTATGGAPLAPALRRLAGGGPDRGSIVLLSDLLTPDWRAGVDGLGLGAGGVVLHILGEEEIDPQLTGDLRLADAETGAEVAVSASGEALARYRAALEAFAAEASGRARRAGLDYVLVPARDGAADQVLSALARAEAVS
ncbi:MAG TPA: DUF58 domain-containing protein [Acidimicrobiia bacterium]|nr:DUF58 domain-containing protein [Acidimicrobiia bacterium]